MIELTGWAIWNFEDWCVDHSNIYSTKERAMEAAKTYFCYRDEEDWGEHMVTRVTIKFHNTHWFEKE